MGDGYSRSPRLIKGAIVHFADQVPGAAIYAPAPSIGWMCGFYFLFVAAILLGKPWRRKAAVALLVWSYRRYHGKPEEIEKVVAAAKEDDLREHFWGG